jgi:glutathione S-transferase
MKGLGESDEAKVTALKEQLNTKLDVYEKILTKQPYLAGKVCYIIGLDR